MTSPFVRRRRLATELRALREQSGMTGDELARRIYRSRMTVSKLENARCRPDTRDVVKILRVLGVTGEKFNEIHQIACDASERGWWDSYGDTMGARQRLYAELESGAAAIRGYYQFSIPGILQTPEFAWSLIELDKSNGPLVYQPQRMVAARQKRQETALRPEGPVCDYVLDEFLLRRLAVPVNVMGAQLHHLARTVASQPRLTVRLLPIDTRIGGGLARSTFTIYSFPDSADPPIAVADTINTDVIHTEDSEVRRYVDQYELLREAALSPVRSLTLLEETAERLLGLAGSGA